jgi:putative sugar O-methyltransferase
MAFIRKRSNKFEENQGQTQPNSLTNIQNAAITLAKNYQDLGIEHSEGVWDKKHLRNLDVKKFRGDNVYVWQTRIYRDVNYFLSYIYALKIDKLGLHTKFSESGLFGAETFTFHDKLVSRDLIDSIIELNYLEEKLHLSNIKNLHIIDIGAGYGRLAKRIQEGFEDVRVSCIDAIPVSTCLSRFYLDEYIQNGSVAVHQLDSVEAIPRGNIKLAINIHSFSEMTMNSVQYWVDFLVAKEVEYLFVVPNGPGLTLNDGRDFGVLFDKAGYRIIGKDSKYVDADFAKFAIYPSNYYLLKRDFE